MLYPLSYEGVPIQYKAPRTADQHSPRQAASIHRQPHRTILCPTQCSPPEDTRSLRQNRSYNVRMSIYVDPPTWPAHGTVFSHLISDVSLAELHKFAASGGISERIFLSHQARQLWGGGASTDQSACGAHRVGARPTEAPAHSRRYFVYLSGTQKAPTPCGVGAFARLSG